MVVAHAGGVRGSKVSFHKLTGPIFRCRVGLRAPAMRTPSEARMALF
jgi:hypothetical protein